jgi:hypothetical protein
MYIINPESIKDKFECKYLVAKYLMIKHKIPILSRKDDIYIFANTKNLRDALDKAPIWIWILNLFS